MLNLTCTQRAKNTGEKYATPFLPAEQHAPPSSRHVMRPSFITASMNPFSIMTLMSCAATDMPPPPVHRLSLPLCRVLCRRCVALSSWCVALMLSLQSSFEIPCIDETGCHFLDATFANKIWHPRPCLPSQVAHGEPRLSYHAVGTHHVLARVAVSRLRVALKWLAG